MKIFEGENIVDFFLINIKQIWIVELDILVSIDFIKIYNVP